MEIKYIHNPNCHADTEGHRYDFSFGMSFTGVIDDERVKKYR